MSRGKVIKSSSSSCFRYVAVAVRMEDIEEVVTHHEVTCLFLLHPRNIPHCCLQNVINTCHLEAQLMKWKVKVSSPVTIFKATKSIIFSGGASSTLDN